MEKAGDLVLHKHSKAKIPTLDGVGISKKL
jgi:hypothetical protein